MCHLPQRFRVDKGGRGLGPGRSNSAPAGVEAFAATGLA
jgi:hypothetical protein